MSDSYEHWFDRLSAPQTRGRLFKSALAAGALTLPFARPAVGALDRATRIAGCDVRVDAANCGNACRVTADAHYAHTVNGACQVVAHHAGYQGLIQGILGGGPVVGVLLVGNLTAATARNCENVALLVQKAAHSDCLTPGCPGFDPCDPLGPCAYFLSIGLKCCPSTGIKTGYVPCNCCADSGDGCKAICS